MVGPAPVPPGQPAPGVVHPAAPKPTVVPPAAPNPAAQAQPATNGDGAEGEGKAKKKSKTGVARPRIARPPENHVITVLRPGAKSGKSGDRYNAVRNGMTVKEYVDIMTKEPFNRTVGQAYFTLRWDTDPSRKLLNIGETVIDVPPPPPPKEKKAKVKKEASAEAPKAAPTA